MHGHSMVRRGMFVCGFTGIWILGIPKWCNLVGNPGWLPMGWMGWTKRIRTLRYARKIRAFLGRASVWKVSSCFSKTGEKHVLQNHCKAKNLQTPYQDLPRRNPRRLFAPYYIKEIKLGLRIIQLNTFNCGEGPPPALRGIVETNFHENLVGGFNPLETYYIVSQIGSFPDIGAKIENIGNIWKKPPPRNIIRYVGCLSVSGSVYKISFGLTSPDVLISQRIW